MRQSLRDFRRKKSEQEKKRRPHRRTPGPQCEELQYIPYEYNTQNNTKGRISKLVFLEDEERANAERCVHLRKNLRNIFESRHFHCACTPSLGENRLGNESRGRRYFACPAVHTTHGRSIILQQQHYRIPVTRKMPHPLG